MASIDLVDERGVLQDTLTMVGGGACVSIVEDAQHRVTMTAQRSEADLLWVSLHDDGAVVIEIKHYEAVRTKVDEEVRIGPDKVFELLLESLMRLRIRSSLKPSQPDVLLAVFRPRLGVRTLRRAAGCAADLRPFDRGLCRRAHESAP